MKLEERITYFVDLGKLDFLDFESVQRQILESNLQDDYLISARVNPHINFGSTKRKNKLNSDLMEKFSKKYFEKFGDGFYDEQGNISDSGISYLTGLKINGLDFSKSDRGGGAIVYVPGQHLFFPVFNLGSNSNDYDKRIQENFSRVVKLNDDIHNTMLDVANSIVSGVFLKDVGYSETIKDTSKDIYVSKDGQDYKLGAKGVRLSSKFGKSVGGFNMFVSSNGQELLDLVDVCGFSKNDLMVTNLQDLLGEEISSGRVRDLVLEHFGKYRSVDFKTISSDDLYRKLK